MSLIARPRSIQIAFFIGISSLIGLIFLALPVGTGDTTELIEGSTNLFACLSNFSSSACESLERFGFTPHLISALLYQIYPNKDVVIVLWSLLNFTAFLTLLIFFYKSYYSNKSIIVSNIFFIGTIFSPLIAYSVYSFSEMMLILLSTIFLYLLYCKKYYLSLIPGLLALTFKDNTFLFLLPLSIAILLISNSKKINYLYLFILTTIGIAVNIFFNSIKTFSYLNNSQQENWVIIDFFTNVNNFFALWFSPSGGVLGYFFLLPLILIIYLIRDFKAQLFHNKIIIALLIISILLTNLNLSLWFSPFGWVAWGPRLFLPTLILFIYTTFLYLKSQEIKFASQFRKWGNYIYFPVSYLMFLTAVGFLINPGVWNSWYAINQANGRFCADVPIWEVDSSGFLFCNQLMMWDFHSLPLTSLSEVLKVIPFGFQTNSLTNYLIFILIFGVSIFFVLLLKENLRVLNKTKGDTNG
jgi:hypothetical protein